MNGFRRTGATSVATLVTLAATCALAHQFAPDWTRTVGLDVWELSSLQEDVAAAEKKEKLIQRQVEQSDRRLAAKEELIDRLLHGTITFAEATAEFHALNRNHPGTMATLRTFYPGACDEEKVACNVLDFALHRATGSLFTRLVVSARLMQGFQHALGE